MAARQGWTLHRSARRDPRALDYGMYWLLRHADGRISDMMTMDEVERYLRGESE
jgi:hypothetical protein